MTASTNTVWLSYVNRAGTCYILYVKLLFTDLKVKQQMKKLVNGKLQEVLFGRCLSGFDCLDLIKNMAVVASSHGRRDLFWPLMFVEDG